MNGKLIVIEGLDGSGKATQAQCLFDTLQHRSAQNVRKVSFPDYESDSSALVRMYLNGAFGTDPDAVNPYAASSFYAVDRFASYTKWKQFYQSGGIVIADRYTTSNAIHQCAKLPESEWTDFIQWLFDYEYRLLGIPAPYRTIYLRVDPDVSQTLMTKRYGGSEEKKDIHEANLAYLKRSRQAADFCARTLHWCVIECVHNGEMRSIQDIAAEVWESVR